MNVLIVQTGEPLHTDLGSPRPMRAMNLANALVDQGHHVVIVSSAFFHQEKRHRTRQSQVTRVHDRLEVHLIPSPGYKRNIGLGRLFDHVVLGVRVWRYLNGLAIIPDVVFVGFPPIEVGYVTTMWAKACSVPCIIDVKDQWPSLFVDAMPKAFRGLGRTLFAPYFALAKLAFKNATGISSMANDFLDWSLDIANRERNHVDNVYPLTSPEIVLTAEQIEVAGNWCRDFCFDDSRIFRILFVGSLMSVFDFESVAEAAKKLGQMGQKVQFVICGDGGYSSHIRGLMAGLENVVFPGWVDRAKVMALSEVCHASIAPYKSIDNFEKNIPNKVIDYLSLGLPILSPLKGEISRLVAEYGVGISYGKEFGCDLDVAIMRLADNEEMRLEMAENAKRLYRDQFDFDTVYGGLVHDLERLVMRSQNVA